MIKATLLSLGILACASCAPQSAQDIAQEGPPTRIVSLDYCADQFVLKFADRESILAVSPDAGKSFSYMADEARGIPVTRSVAEDVLLLRPDLIVRSYGGGPNAAAFFERAGIPVITVGWAGDLDGVKALNLDMATQLGAPEKGRAIVADMEGRLAAIKKSASAHKALYVTPGGVTSGPGSLVHEMMVAAGLENYLPDAGWRSLPLEQLVYDAPDMIAAAYFEDSQNAWSAAAHPVARRQTDTLPRADIQGAWTTCGGWFLVDAIEALAKAGGDYAP